jgi:hypothetical protein
LDQAGGPPKVCFLGGPVEFQVVGSHEMKQGIYSFVVVASAIERIIRNILYKEERIDRSRI